MIVEHDKKTRGRTQNLCVSNKHHDELRYSASRRIRDRKPIYFFNACSLRASDCKVSSDLTYFTPIQDELFYTREDTASRTVSILELLYDCGSPITENGSMVGAKGRPEFCDVLRAELFVLVNSTVIRPELLRQFVAQVYSSCGYVCTATMGVDLNCGCLQTTFRHIGCP
jgi:hypothetical protein